MARPLARTPGGPALASAAAKLATLIPEPYAESPDRFRAAVGVREPPAKLASNRRDLIKVLLQAITDRQTLEVDYHFFGRGARTERRLDPYHLWW